MEKIVNGKQSEDMINQIYLYRSNNVVRELKHIRIVMNVSGLITKK